MSLGLLDHEDALKDDCPVQPRRDQPWAEMDSLERERMTFCQRPFEDSAHSNQDVSRLLGAPAKISIRALTLVVGQYARDDVEHRAAPDFEASRHLAFDEPGQLERTLRREPDAHQRLSHEPLREG